MSQQSHANRDRRTIAAVACPVCSARVGEPCRLLIEHGPKAGQRETRSSPVHSERRAAWKMVRDGEAT